MKDEMEKMEGREWGVKMSMGVGDIVGDEREKKYGKGKGGFRWV